MPEARHARPLHRDWREQLALARRAGLKLNDLNLEVVSDGVVWPDES
jgi:hypothetical protein